jgi:hypothetical protein
MIKRGLTLDNTLNITSRVFINDAIGPDAGYTTAPAMLANGKPLPRASPYPGRRDNANAHLKRAAETGCTSQVMGRDAQRWLR